MHVYILTAEIADTFGGIYDGITSVHSTQVGALKRLAEWMDYNKINPETANLHHGASYGRADPDLDLNNGAEIHWGINLIEVQE